MAGQRNGGSNLMFIGVRINGLVEDFTFSFPSPSPSTLTHLFLLFTLQSHPIIIILMFNIYTIIIIYSLSITKLFVSTIK